MDYIFGIMIGCFIATLITEYDVIKSICEKKYNRAFAFLGTYLFAQGVAVICFLIWFDNLMG